MVNGTEDWIQSIQTRRGDGPVHLGLDVHKDTIVVPVARRLSNLETVIREAIG